MKILSADHVASIPKASIKKFVKRYFKANITDEGAEEIVKILEEKAKEISRYAVDNAKRESRGKVTRTDVMKYVIKGYDE
ncbi:MAG TPA: histone-like protein [Candidatus Saccharimonadales bacterium]|nr:histone-like protein [Candidatus Saccharimonadales bacterium]